MSKHLGNFFYQQKSLTTVVILFASSTIFTPPIVSLIISPALAQSTGVSTSFPVPQSVPNGTEVRIDGTTSMEKINQALVERFKTKFPGTDVKVLYDGTDASLKALPDGKIDLAAIGRSLTETEKAQGLISTPIARNKIAIIVSKDNPYKNSLTSEQFAKIFRGEITNWSQVGGSPQAIRLIDRPENSDLRQALKNYPVFQAAPFKTGANAVKLSQDSTEAVIKELGANGIGYAIADQVVNNPNVLIVSLHKVLPTDPRYPFSQPLGYAYQKSNPSPAAQAFLGYATAPENQRIVEEARNGVISTPEAQSTPAPTATTETEFRGGFPWWLLSIPLLGGLLWWLLNRRTTTSSPYRLATPTSTPVSTPESRLILVPRNARDAYAYWEVPEARKAELRRQGGRKLALRVYDATGIDLERQSTQGFQQFDCDESTPDLHIPIAHSERNYVAELGYVTDDGRWLKLARSAPVEVPSTPWVDNATKPLSGTETNNVGATFERNDNISTAATNVANKVSGTIAAGTTAVAGMGTAARTFLDRDRLQPDGDRSGQATAPLHTTSDQPAIKSDCRIILVPRNSEDAYVYWEISDEYKAAARRQGGRKFVLRVHDVTNLDIDNQPPHSTQEYLCDERDQDKHVSIPVSNRDYMAEVGYYTEANRWLSITRSFHVHIPFE